MFSPFWELGMVGTERCRRLAAGAEGRSWLRVGAAGRSRCGADSAVPAPGRRRSAAEGHGGAVSARPLHSGRGGSPCNCSSVS